MVSLAKAFASLNDGEVSVPSDKQTKLDKAVRTKNVASGVLENDAKHRNVSDLASGPVLDAAEVRRRASLTAAFKARLIANDLTVARFAAMTGMNERTIAEWTHPNGTPPAPWADAWLDTRENVPEARAYQDAKHPKVKAKPRGKPFTSEGARKAKAAQS